MAANGFGVSIEINSILKENLYSVFHYPIICTFRRYIYRPQSEEKGLCPNCGQKLPPSPSHPRYRLSLRLVDRLGHTLKSGKPITLTNRGLIQYDRPEELNTLYVIFDYDVQNNTR